MRAGYGYDFHRLEKGVPLYIGGIQIPHEKGAAGHSDADVLLHAVCDALLGAAGMRDIGYYFPDSDPAYKGADSKKLLEEVKGMVEKEGFSVGNLDTTVLLERPKLAAYVPAMIKMIAELLEVEEGRVSVKATTHEKTGPVGREEGVAAHAVVLLEE